MPCTRLEETIAVADTCIRYTYRMHVSATAPAGLAAEWCVRDAVHPVIFAGGRRDVAGDDAGGRGGR